MEMLVTHSGDVHAPEFIGLGQTVAQTFLVGGLRGEFHFDVEVQRGVAHFVLHVRILFKYSVRSLPAKSQEGNLSFEVQRVAWGKTWPPQLGKV